MREGILNARESERAYRLAVVAAYAMDVFCSDLSRVVLWLRTPNLVLRQFSPLSHLDTQAGARAAIHVLQEAQYGMPA